MRHGSLFSGIGGFDLAAQWMGWENVFHCEWNDFGQRVLKYYWPNAISYGDINKTDFTIHRGGIDILTGGFPCQPFSLAGKRKGTADDRHLWPRMLEVIREIQPLWVVGENVYGLTNWDGGVVFEQVCADLEREGYEVQPVIIPACAVNAPHRRDRVWIIAKNTGSDGCRNGRYDEQWSIGDERKLMSGGKEWDIREQNGSDGSSADSPGMGQRQGAVVGTEVPEEFRGAKSDKRDKSQDVTDTDLSGYAREGKQSFAKREIRTCSNIRQWDNFPTVSPLCDRNDGLSDRLADITFPKWRNESIKAMGNAIVPQVAYEIFKVIELIN